jgi:tetratricopeptide (TPR) repeat protein
MPSEKGKADLQEISDEYKRAEYAFQARRYDLAIEIMQQALSAHPDNSLAYVTITRAYMRKKQNPEALAAIKAALLYDPGNAYAHSLCGHLLGQDNQRAAAQQEFLTSLALEPSRATTHNLYSAFLLEKVRDWAGAREHAQQAVTLDPADARFHMTLGSVLAAGRRLDEAEAAYQKALQLDPDDFMILRNYGEFLLFYRARLAEAYQLLSQALTRNPEDVYARRGVLLAIKLRGWFYRLYWSYMCFVRRQGKTGKVIRYVVLLTPFVLRGIQAGDASFSPLGVAFVITALFDIYVYGTSVSVRSLMRVPKQGK